MALRDEASLDLVDCLKLVGYVLIMWTCHGAITRRLGDKPMKHWFGLQTFGRQSLTLTILTHIRFVYTGVQNDTSIYGPYVQVNGTTTRICGPYIQPVYTGRVYG